MLNKLPDELLVRIFSHSLDDIDRLIQLLQVSKRFYRLLFIENPKLWYLAFKLKYPVWSHKVNYIANTMDWKSFVIGLNKQQHGQLSFEFVQECRKRKRVVANEPPFWIQDPLVVDIDRITQSGVVATGKHRKKQGYSEHKILFWEYPSWKLKRVFELTLQPQSLACQIIGIQSIRMISQDNIPYKARFFSLAIGTSLINGIDTELEDRADIWKSLFVYRLFDNGDTQCMLHLKINDMFLGREVFFFSDTSWCQSNDGDTCTQDQSVSKVQDWLKITQPEQLNFDIHHTVFVLAMGPVYHHVTGYATLSKFDIRGDQDILDPSLVQCTLDNRGQLMATSEAHAYLCSTLLMLEPFQSKYSPPTEMISRIRLGSDVSCMIHFKYPPHLNHLICTGSSQEDELSVYDWRFGVKVGTLPWKSRIDNPDIEGVRPWGLETTLVLPHSEGDLAHHGFRLIAVGDNRGENVRAKLEIKVWDISYLLQVRWDPLQDDNNNHDLVLSDYLENYLQSQFTWWPRRTQELTKLALYTIQRKFGLHQYQRLDQHFISTIHQNYQQHQAPLFQLPYAPPQEYQSVLLSHTLDKVEIPVRYTAYNVLNTSLFLLTEDGQVTVMDIESGQVRENVATNHPRVRGIDVNVVGGNEVVVTSKEGLLRAIVS